MSHDVFKVINYLSPDAAQEMAASFQETGFAILDNHPIQFVDEVYDLWRKAFSQNQLTQFPFDPEKLDGFICQEQSETAVGYTQKDIKMFFNYYPQWGRCPDYLITVTQAYFDSIRDCGMEIAKWLDQMTPATHKPDHCSFANIIQQSTRNLLRLNYFPAVGTNYKSGAIRAQDHTDINFFTLIPRTSSPGLQVLYKGEQWVDVPCHKNWVVINIGDMLQELSNGYWPSTRHRVVNYQENMTMDRMSTPLFFQPNDDVYLSTRYPKSIDFLRKRYEELGLV